MTQMEKDLPIDDFYRTPEELKEYYAERYIRDDSKSEQLKRWED